MHKFIAPMVVFVVSVRGGFLTKKTHEVVNHKPLALDGRQVRYSRCQETHQPEARPGRVGVVVQFRNRTYLAEYRPRKASLPPEGRTVADRRFRAAAHPGMGALQHLGRFWRQRRREVHLLSQHRRRNGGNYPPCPHFPSLLVHD